MRIWHYELIPVLPQKQLLGQWRELSAIIGLINKFGNPNTLIVNKVMNFLLSDFKIYISFVENEIRNRGYFPRKNISEKLETILINNFNTINFKLLKTKKIFKNWHNDRYFFQCFFNLQEKYDCGGIKDEDWQKIKNLALKKLRKTELNLYDIL